MEEQNQNKWQTAVGIGLMTLLMLLWMNWMAPKPEEQAAQQAQQRAADTLKTEAQKIDQPAASPAPAGAPDSLLAAKAQLQFGDFARAASGKAETASLENELLKVDFSTKGGWIKQVWLKKYQKVADDGKGNEVKGPLILLNNEQNKFELALPVAAALNGSVKTSDLFFTAQKEGDRKLILTADAGNGRSLQQVFELSADGYELAYEVKMNNLGGVFAPGAKAVRVSWLNFLDKLEKNHSYESQYSSVYFKENDDDPEYCDCRKGDVKELGDRPLRWISHSNQFFNTTLAAESGSFRNARLSTQMMDAQSPVLKLLGSDFDLPLAGGGNEAWRMKIYAGPNEMERLKPFAPNAEEIIPFGSSIFGTINRWIMHPVFTFLMKILGSAGLSILALTIIVKLAVYPLTYKMVHSQAKQTALKPQMEALRKKHGDDQQKMSMESMKLYQEYGVNPVGGCMPMLLQMPIWFALYRFFPASIEFRQQSFLWATDLSSYDAWLKLPFSLFGAAHISLFTIIWTVTTLWYTWYTMRQMDNAMTQNNPQMQMMKWMQYLMPIMFFFFFNTFASGLSCYLSFSNILNIVQTLVTKNYLIDHDKIRAALEKNKSKPKKGFSARFEEAVKEAQKQQLERDAAKKKK